MPVNETLRQELLAMREEDLRMRDEVVKAFGFCNDHKTSQNNGKTD